MCFYFAWKRASNGMGRSHGMFMFNFLRDFKMFSKVVVILHSYQQCIRILVFHILSSTWYVQSFYSSHSNGGIVVSHCGFISISLMTNDVEHLSPFLFAIHMFSLAKHLFISWGAGAISLEKEKYFQQMVLERLAIYRQKKELWFIFLTLYKT